MRKDPGVSGDAQRIEQLGWMITLKIMDDKDKELKLLNFKYPCQGAYWTEIREPLIIKVLMFPCGHNSW